MHKIKRHNDMNMKRKLLRYSTFLILLLCSSFKSLQAVNERESNRISWVNKWKRELATQIGYHSVCSVCVNTIRYIPLTYLNKRRRRYLNPICGAAYILVHSRYIRDKYVARQHKPYTQKDYVIPICLIASIGTGHVIDVLIDFEEERSFVERFALGSFAAVGLHRLGRLARKLYTKGYSGLEYEDIAPPSDIIGALAFTWEASKFNDKGRTHYVLFPASLALLSVVEYEQAARMVPNKV